MASTFIASLDNLFDMLAFILRHAQQIGIPEQHLSKIELASEEILVNIISYGYPSSSGQIEIHCLPCSHNPGMQIVVIDHGIPFNPLIKATNPIKHYDPLSEDNIIGGYGIFFVLEVMDEVSYQRKGNTNVVTLYKYF